MQNKIKYLRRSQEFDMTQDELAEKVGVSRATISAIENGASTSVEIAIRIAEVFNRDPRDIFFGDHGAHSLHPASVRENAPEKFVSEGG